MQVQCHMSSWRQSKVGVVKIDAAKQMQQHKNTISDLSQSEVRRKQAIEMMRLAMYGQAGGPGEDSEVETSDEEKYMVQW